MSKEIQANDGKGGWIFFLAGFVGMLVIGWFIFPMLLYSSENQPVSFSHKAHVENAGLECEGCHGFRDDGTFWGIPNLATGNPEGQCLTCHDDPESPQGEDPREMDFLKAYVAKEAKKIDWKVYAAQPPCVYFPHSVHVVKAEMECASCHGPAGELDEPRVYQENRLTGYSRDIWGKNIGGFSSGWERMKMDDCAKCHTEKGTSNACFVCHK